MRCPLCGMIAGDNNRCAKCGLIAPNAELFLNSDTVSIWKDDYYSIKRKLEGKTEPEIKKEQAPINKNDELLLCVLQKSNVSKQPYNARYERGSIRNPIIISCTPGQLITGCTWSKVLINDKRSVRLSLPANTNIFFGCILEFTVVNKTYYCVIRDKNESNSSSNSNVSSTVPRTNSTKTSNASKVARTASVLVGLSFPYVVLAIFAKMGASVSPTGCYAIASAVSVVILMRTKKLIDHKLVRSFINVVLGVRIIMIITTILAFVMFWIYDMPYNM
ncbi:MAG: hypothetical protein IJ869_07375 [Clostridiales bacterium]|nr:hypothetical protein [Clostridiales bacterium]